MQIIDVQRHRGSGVIPERRRTRLHDPRLRASPVRAEVIRYRESRIQLRHPGVAA
jgi:hypothetical protein